MQKGAAEYSSELDRFGLWRVSGALLPTVTVAALVGTVSEGDASKGKFVATRTGNTATAQTVSNQVGGQAVAGANYQRLGGSVVIPVGKATAKIKAFPVRPAHGRDLTGPVR